MLGNTTIDHRQLRADLLSLEVDLSRRNSPSHHGSTTFNQDKVHVGLFASFGYTGEL